MDELMQALDHWLTAPEQLRQKTHVTLRALMAELGAADDRAAGFYQRLNGAEVPGCKAGLALGTERARGLDGEVAPEASDVERMLLETNEGGRRKGTLDQRVWTPPTTR